MGRKGKIHFSEAKKPGDVLWQTACGRFEITATNRPELVTCKQCRRQLARQTANRDLAHPDDSWGEISGLFDLTTGLPVLTPDTYKRRDCTCGSCAVCRHEAAIKREQYVAPWADRPHLRPKRPAWRFATVNEALGWYADTVEDGYPQRSLGDVFERLGKVGAMIQSSGSGDTKAIRDADDRVAIELAMTLAARVEPDVSTNMALAVLFAAAVGPRSTERSGRIGRTPLDDEAIAELSELTPQSVGALVKRLKKRIRAFLVGCGLLRGAPLK